MQPRRDLWSDLTNEVQLADMVNKEPNARAGKPEAMRIAKEVLRENDDVLDNELPSPLIAQPADLLRFQLGQVKAADLSKSHVYPVVRGGAWCTKRGRIIIVEFKDILNEAIAPITVAPNRTRAPKATRNTVIPTRRGSVGAGTIGARWSEPNSADALKPYSTADLPNRATADLPPVKPQQAKHGHPNSYGPSDEGSHATITVLAKHPKLYQMDWMPDEKVAQMGGHAGFHVFGEEENLKWRPMTLQLYIKLAELAKGARTQQAQTMGLPQDDSIMRFKRAAPNPKATTVAPAKPGEEPTMSDELGVAKPRKKLFGVF